jgi:hypothetical protein
MTWFSNLYAKILAARPNGAASSGAGLFGTRASRAAFKLRYYQAIADAKAKVDAELMALAGASGKRS